MSCMTRAIELESQPRGSDGADNDGVRLTIGCRPRGGQVPFWPVRIIVCTQYAGRTVQVTGRRGEVTQPNYSVAGCAAKPIQALDVAMASSVPGRNLPCRP